jgi:pimeloyl-ACP methyl ester carboxylesterase
MLAKGSSATYVFVHGSFHGAWCWYKVTPLLRSHGRRAIALDLPAHGLDRTPIKDVTLDGYSEAVCDVLRKESEPVVLVGHSRGGIVISQAAEKCPEMVKKLVYLSAFLIPNGQAMLPIALGDGASILASNLEVNESEGWHMVKESALRPALYADCSDEDVELARSLLTPEPNAPVATPLKLTEGNFGRIPRAYIETLADRGVSITLQRKMRESLPCQEVLSIDASHSPFLSKPGELVSLLLSLG